MTRRVVVVGADAAGMSAASQALRRAGRDALEVVAFERGPHVSYLACGIPYWVSGEVDGPEALIARSLAQHRANGVDLRLRTEVTEIDLDARKLSVAPLDGGVSYQVGFDDLVLATGAVPVRPELPGVRAPGVYGVQTLDDGTALLAGLAERPHRAVVVGGGYIGIEMIEAMVRMGITVRTGTPVSGFETGAAGRVNAVITEGGGFRRTSWCWVSVCGRRPSWPARPDYPWARPVAC